MFFIFKSIAGIVIGRTFIEVCHMNNFYPEKELANLLNINSDVLLWSLVFVVAVLLLFIEHWIHKVKWSWLAGLVNKKVLQENGFNNSKIRFPKIAQISFDEKANFLNLFSTREMIGTSEDMGIWGEPDHRITSFFLKGRNNRKEPINRISGRITSTKTNLSIPILLDGMKPEETHGIPGKCDFYVVAMFPDSKPPKQGYTVEDFWRHFGGFDFIFEYDGKTITKHFPEKIVRPYLERKIQESASSLAPKDKPRVKKAQQ